MALLDPTPHPAPTAPTLTDPAVGRPAVGRGRPPRARLGSVLGVWAHPDDESYLAAGLMLRARSAGDPVVSVSATLGDAGLPDLPRPTVAELRRAELDAALAVLDVGGLPSFGYPDGRLAEVDARPAVARILALLRRHRPDTVVTFGPDGLTGHPDHVTVSGWVGEAVRRSPRPPRLLPVTTTAGFADEFADLHERFPVFADGLPLRTPPDRVDVTVRLAGADLDRKMAALDAHASQTRVLRDAVGARRYRRWWQDEHFVDAA